MIKVSRYQGIKVRWSFENALDSENEIPSASTHTNWGMYGRKKRKKVENSPIKPTEKQQDASSKFQTNRIFSTDVKTLESRIPLVSRFYIRARILRARGTSSIAMKTQI